MAPGQIQHARETRAGTVGGSHASVDQSFSIRRRRAWAYRDQASHFRHREITPRALGVSIERGPTTLCRTGRPPPFGRLIDRRGSHESDKVRPGDGIQPVSGQRHKRPYGVAPVRPFGWGRLAVDHAANACRTAAASNFSPASVNRDPLINPILANVTSATGSQKSAETPSANIAIARCSSESRSFQEIPSISHLGPFVTPDSMTGRKS